MENEYRRGAAARLIIMLLCIIARNMKVMAMATLTVTARGQVTFRKDVLKHLGIQPGDKIRLDLLPDGRAELKPRKPKGRGASCMGCSREKATASGFQRTRSTPLSRKRALLLASLDPTCRDGRWTDTISERADIVWLRQATNTSLVKFADHLRT